MKKTIGHYTTAAAKSLKTSSLSFAIATDDGDIYVSNGYILYKLTAAEYAAIVQPVTLLRGRALDHRQNWQARQ